MITFVLIGMLILLVLGLPLAFGIGGATLVGFLASNLQPSNFITTTFGSLDSFTLMAVPFFILAGSIMEVGGISERLINLAKLFIGKIYGGLGVLSCVACALFGAVSGSAPATTAAIGGIMIPEMKKAGYDKFFCAALMTVAGSVGALIPPSLSFILYSSATGVNIGDLFIAGILPGILLTGCLSIVCVWSAKKRGWKPVEAEKKDAHYVMHTVKESLLAIIMPIIILGGIYGGFFTPTEAGAVSCVYAFIVSVFVYKQLDFKGLIKVISKSSKLCVVCLLVAGFCDPFVKVLTLGGVPSALMGFMHAVSTNKYVFLLVLDLILLLVGMFVDFVPAMLILGPMIYPIAMSFGVNPIHLGIVMSFNLIVGLSTPPVGSSLYVASGMTGLPVAGIVKEQLPFFAAAIICLLLVTFIEPISTIWFL